MRSAICSIRYLLIVMFLMAVTTTTQAQKFKPIIDSLENLLRNGNVTGTARIDLTNKLCTYMVRKNTERAKVLAGQALSESLKADYREGEGLAYMTFAMIYQQNGVLDSGLLYADKAGKILPSFSKRIIETGVCYQLKAMMYRVKNQNGDAITAYMEATKYFEKGNYKPGIADCYVGIGAMFVVQQQYEKAIEYHKKGLKAYKDLDLQSFVAQQYDNLGITATRMKQYPQALNYFNMGLKTVKAQGDTSGIGDVYSDMGESYYAMQKYPEAIDVLNKSAGIRRKIKDERNLSFTLNFLGLCYEKLGNKAKAIAYMKQAHTLAVKLNNTQQIQDSFEAMSAFYAHNRQLDSAYYFSNKFKLLKDSVDIIDNKKAFSALVVKYETQKKQQQIDLLNKENTIQKLSIAGHNKTLGIIIGLFVLAAIIGGLFYNRNKLQQKTALQQQMLQQQDQLTKAIIEAEEKERKRIASDLHDGVGQLFSAVKMNLSGLMERVTIDRPEDRFLAEKTLALVDESCKEVRVISHQMMPNMLLRSGIASDVKSFIEKIDSERLKVNVETNGFKNRIESNVETVLYRVIQETVNNVIKHSKASKLDILLNREPSGITAVVADNGIGFNTQYKDDYAGIGLKNIAARIEYLKGTVEYYSSPGKGTSVNIWVPMN